MAENREEQVLGCLYATVLMKSGYRIDIGVEKDDGGKDVCYVVVSDKDDTELLILRSDSKHSHADPKILCQVASEAINLATSRKPTKELSMMLEVLLSNVHVHINPDDVSVVFYSECE